MSNINNKLEQLKDFIGTKPPKVSFELFPPKTDELTEKLWDSVERLQKFKPEYISVTYGAGGSTREKTFEIVKTLKERFGINPAAHLTCVNATKEEINAIAKSYLDIGVNKIVALRGDPPGLDGEYVPYPGGYKFADDLVEGLMKIGNFDLSVAAYPEKHPQAKSLEADIEHLKRKADNGATRAITQYCFDTDTVLRFIDKAVKAGVNIPIVPGIMAISNFKQLVNFSGRCGASVPDWLIKLFDGLDENPESRRAVAVMVAAEQCRILMQAGIGEFHIYTLNQADVTMALCRVLGGGK